MQDQDQDLCKIRSGAGDKKTSGVDAENKLNGVYKNNYRINLDHQILTDHGVMYLQALYNDLIFKLTLAPAAQLSLFTSWQISSLSTRRSEAKHLQTRP